MAVVFAVTCCQMSSCWGRKDCVLPSVFFFWKKKSSETRGETPCDERWKFTVCHFIQVLLKLVLSLYMSLRFWYKSKSHCSTEREWIQKPGYWRVKSVGDPSLGLYCASCPSIEANRCLHSDISAHIQESNKRGSTIPFLKPVISEGKKSLKKKKKRSKLKTILQYVVLSTLYVASLNLTVHPMNDINCWNLLFGIKTAGIHPTHGSFFHSSPWNDPWHFGAFCAILLLHFADTSLSIYSIININAEAGPHFHHWLNVTLQWRWANIFSIHHSSCSTSVHIRILFNTLRNQGSIVFFSLLIYGLVFIMSRNYTKINVKQR